MQRSYHNDYPRSYRIWLHASECIRMQHPVWCESFRLHFVLSSGFQVRLHSMHFWHLLRKCLQEIPVHLHRSLPGNFPYLLPYHRLPLWSVSWCLLWQAAVIQRCSIWKATPHSLQNTDSLSLRRSEWSYRLLQTAADNPAVPYWIYGSHPRTGLSSSGTFPASLLLCLSLLPCPFYPQSLRWSG